MSGHTPGPWKLVQESVDPSWHIITAAGGRITVNIHIEAGNATDIANARLIAAAPEMLEALKMAQQVINAHIPNEMPVCVPGVSRYIREAIANAEGRA